MSQQGGGPQQPGYNPNAVGAMPHGGANPAGRGQFLGVADANVGTGMALNNLGALKGNVPISFFQQKDTGWKRKMQEGLGMRTSAQFVGFEGIKPAEMASQGHDGGMGGPPMDVAAGLGLGDSEYEQSRQSVFGSKHAHKSLHNQMPGPTEFISPLNLNPTQLKKIYGESDNGGGGGGGGNATYEQIYGAGVVIYQNGAVHMGFTPEFMLGGLSPPSTPERGRKSEYALGA